MTEIVPVLWFDDQAEQAMAFYTEIFPDGRVTHVERYPDASLDPHFAGMTGKVITGVFELAGLRLQCLDGGPLFPHSPAISFHASFAEAALVEQIWQRLTDGGTVLMPLQAYPWAPLYGWCQDRFGVSWQLSQDGETPAGQRITPSLMFTGPAAGRAREAMERYTALFEGSAVDQVTLYDGGDGDTAGLVKHARFHLGGSHLMASDSSHPHGFTFSEAISLLVQCADQAEIDRYWAALTADGGREGQCGWCTDAYGVSWQIVPADLADLLGSDAAIQAMMQMTKFDIATLTALRHP